MDRRLQEYWNNPACAPLKKGLQLFLLLERSIKHSITGKHICKIHTTSKPVLSGANPFLHEWEKTNNPLLHTPMTEHRIKLLHFGVEFANIKKWNAVHNLQICENLNSDNISSPLYKQEVISSPASIKVALGSIPLLIKFTLSNGNIEAPNHLSVVSFSIITPNINHSEAKIAPKKGKSWWGDLLLDGFDPEHYTNFSVYLIQYLSDLTSVLFDKDKLPASYHTAYDAFMQFGLNLDIVKGEDIPNV